MAQLYPFTDPRAADQTPPITIASGDGCWVTDVHGTRYMDAVAGLWCTALGWSNRELIDAAQAQMQQLPYYHSFKGRSIDVTDQLATKLAQITPEGIERFFFGCSGSEAVDIAVKIARFYQNGRGKTDKKQIISRHGAYHGSLTTSAGLTGLAYAHGGFDLPWPIRVGRPHYHGEAHSGESEAQFTQRLVDELEATITDHGTDTIAAMIGEPVMGAGGVIIPPAGYWAGVQEVLKAHDILLIADEVICGFGRTGSWFGCNTYGIAPQMMTMAKQLTSAYAPLSAVGIHADMYEVIADFGHQHGTFGHGLTYGGHPVSCAVALKAIEIYERMDVEATVQARGAHLAKRLERFKTMNSVGNVRSKGLIAAVELDPASGLTGAMVGAEAEKRGVFFRIIGDTIAMSPPLIVSDDEIDHFTDVLEDSIQAAG
ncbi:aminotransferase [Nereida sp. MMG025]|uniref:aminotransferase n=1 Tax=Nereida sp. MMG025 TaxID=2909981 RepID=UPI001F02C5F7|nr:aminotransferase [Nereida sp. MMG025]MCF6445637.1 aminotransferase [Nereida sp. MMG025]